jgi:hypothetical protein
VFVIIPVGIAIFTAVYESESSNSSSSNSGSRSSGFSSSSGSSSTQTAKKPQWDTSTSKDEMTGRRQVFASSPTVFPTKQMDFPYSDVKGWLGVGCEGSREWVYVGFNNSPNLADTETEDGYNRIKTRIKWDGAIQNVTLIQEWGASFLHFQNDSEAISKIGEANTALLELKWHGQQPTYFKFSLDGSSAALKTMRAKCGS